MAAATSRSQPPLSSSGPPTPTFAQPAARLPPSISSAANTAPEMNRQQPADAGPNENYPTPITTQLAQSAYYEPPTHRAFTNEEAMQMANSLSQGMHHNQAAQLAGGRDLSNGTEHGHLVGDLASDALPQGMAPPSQASHLTGPPAQHAVVDPHQDFNYSGDGGRRKRSKVSRACDECRRKKIRCDATTDDGSVKTCSNCTRLQAICTFSRVPMKRGPSKGYIKELSERVQHVESQMAMSGQGSGSGYRPSMDASSPSGMYTETSYSPPEALSLKRTFSMSEGRNPFSQPHFANRDRMPSAGGWSVNSTGPNYRSNGGRASIAIAPDQQLPDVDSLLNGPPLDLSRPFWAQDSNVEDQHFRKRIRSDETSTDTSAEVAEMNDELLEPYLKTIHPVLPILPTSIVLLAEHTRACSTKLTQAFTYSLSVATGQRNPSGGPFSSYKAVEDYVWSEARDSPYLRSTSENIVWLWSYALMIFNADKDLRRLRGADGALAKGRLVKMAVDLGRYLMKNSQKELNETEPLDSVSRIIRRAWNCVGILARFHSLSTATDDDIPLDGYESIGTPDDCSAVLTDVASFLARSSNVISIINTIVQDENRSKSQRVFSIKNRKLIQQHLDHIIHSTPQTPAVGTYVKHIELFFSILLGRLNIIQHPVDILAPSLELVESLSKVSSSSCTGPASSPLDIHFFTLATITLLEFTDLVDSELSNPSWDALSRICQPLELIAKRGHDLVQQNSTEDHEHGNDGGLHWADALLRMIDSKPRFNIGHNAAAEAGGDSFGTEDGVNGSGSNNNALNGNGSSVSTAQESNLQQLADMASTQDKGQGEKTYDSKGGKVQMVDFAELTKVGYLNVIAARCGF